MRPLNFENLVLTPDRLDACDGSPWGEVIWDEGCVISTYAANAALNVLKPSWEDDAGADRAFVLNTLDTTIRILTRWRTAFEVAVVSSDMEEEARALLDRDTVSADTLRAVAVTLDQVRLRCAGWENAEALTRAAFAFSPEEEFLRGVLEDLAEIAKTMPEETP